MRGTGKTTKRLLGLSHSGIYVVGDRMQARYCKAIAMANNRPDITILLLSEVAMYLMGRKISDIAIDHYLYEVESLHYLSHVKELGYSRIRGQECK